MDLRFGLNETRDGYKVKNALWNYICTYGPPKTILNDLGKEFMNNVINDLTNSLGM